MMALENPSFEGEYTVRVFNEVKVAQDWAPFFKEGGSPPDGGQQPCVRPEYKPLTRNVDEHRIIDGDKSQCWFVRWNVMDAGVYQKVSSLPVGKDFQFGCWAQAWCSNKDDPRLSDGELYFALGVDLGGGINPWADSVIWTPWKWIGADYVQFSIGGQTKSTELTVFCRAWNKWKLKHADCYVDKASFEIEGSGGGNGVTENDVRRIFWEEMDKVAHCMTT